MPQEGPALGSGEPEEAYLLSPTMLTEAAVIPRAVLDLGFWVDVQEGALLIAAFPCRKCVHVAS